MNWSSCTTLFKDFFLMWTIFKVFIEFIIILLLFYVFGFFGHEACGILASWSVIKPAPLALEGKVLTTGLWGSPSSITSIQTWQDHLNSSNQTTNFDFYHLILVWYYKLICWLFPIVFQTHTHSSFAFPLLVLRNNWHTFLYKFEVYSVMVGWTYTVKLWPQ